MPFSQKRAEFSQGKRELKEDEKDLPAAFCGINIWHRILPRSLVYGFGTMLILVALIKLSGRQPTPLPIVLVVLGVNVITPTLIINRYLPMVLLSHAKGLGAGPMATPQSLAGYLVVEHPVSFILSHGCINPCVANRAFHFEAAKAGLEYVTANALLPDAFITFVLLVLLQWMFSNALTRGDVRLGKVPVDKLKNISGRAALGKQDGYCCFVRCAWGLYRHPLGRHQGNRRNARIILNSGCLAFGQQTPCWLTKAEK